MDCTLDRAPFSVAGPCCRVVGALELDYIAFRVLDDFFALDYISIFQTHFTVGLQAEELLGSIFHEIGAFDVEFACERDLAGRSFRLGGNSCGVEGAVEPFHLPFRVVGDGKLDGVLNDHVAVGTGVQVLPYAPFEELDVHQLVTLAHADLVAEHLECLGGVATPADAAERRHAGVIPSCHEPLLH